MIIQWLSIVFQWLTTGIKSLRSWFETSIPWLIENCTGNPENTDPWFPEDFHPAVYADDDYSNSENVIFENSDSSSDSESEEDQILPDNDGRFSVSGGISGIPGLIDSGLWSDMTIYLGKEQVEVKAHKLILRAHSRIFNSLFNEYPWLSYFGLPRTVAEEFKLLLKVPQSRLP